MDMIPWQALTAAGGGWALTGLCVFLLMTGKLRTERELSAMERRAEKAEELNHKLLGINEKALNAGDLTVSAIEAAARIKGQPPAGGSL